MRRGTPRSLTAFGCLVAVLLPVLPGGALAQRAPRPADTAPVVPVAPVPSTAEVSALIWGTFIAIDQANRTGNYSVLRDLGAPGFQQLNDPARLAALFASLRDQRVDLSASLLVAPVLAAEPALVAPDVLRTRGRFDLRPTALAFDLYYQWSGGRWRLYGVSIEPVPLPTRR